MSLIQQRPYSEVKKEKMSHKQQVFNYSPLSKKPKSRRASLPFADYSVSPTEQYQLGDTPMKKVPSCERRILTNSRSNKPRISYLQSRYQHVPNEKYYYPAATSWRYGWHVQSSTTAAQESS